MKNTLALTLMIYHILLLREEHNTLSIFAGQKKRVIKIDIKLKELLAYSQILLTWTLF
jgi:hypothetical protein